MLALLMLAGSPADAVAQSQSSTSRTQIRSVMQKFVLIFRQGSRVLTEDEKARRQQEVVAWAQQQNTAGHKLDPRMLAPDVARVGAGMAPETDGANWPISALLFLEASDLAEAAKIAGAHPALAHGVSVEVRPWAPPPTKATP
jgi:hypothetical protein